MELLPLLLCLTAVVAFAINVLRLMSRFVRAHERIATALEDSARNLLRRDFGR